MQNVLFGHLPVLPLKTSPFGNEISLANSCFSHENFV